MSDPILQNLNYAAFHLQRTIQDLEQMKKNLAKDNTSLGKRTLGTIALLEANIHHHILSLDVLQKEFIKEQVVLHESMAKEEEMRKQHELGACLDRSINDHKAKCAVNRLLEEEEEEEELKLENKNREELELKKAQAKELEEELEFEAEDKEELDLPLKYEHKRQHELEEDAVKHRFYPHPYLGPNMFRGH